MKAAAAVSLALCLAATPAAADGIWPELKPYFGDYVGQARQTGGSDGIEREIIRDIDVTIAEFGKGFQIDWVTVMHRGDRAGTGVRRRAEELRFLPSDLAGVYKWSPPRDFFKTIKRESVVEGRPLIWSRIVGAELRIYSLVVQDNGSYTLQVYGRALSEDRQRLAVDFKSYLDGQLWREVAGRMARAAQ